MTFRLREPPQGVHCSAFSPSNMAPLLPPPLWGREKKRPRGTTCQLGRESPDAATTPRLGIAFLQPHIRFVPLPANRWPAMHDNDHHALTAAIAPFRAAYAPADEDMAAAFLKAAPGPPEAEARIDARARRLVEAIRAKHGVGGV